MTKNLALAASITMLIAISGQAFADTASTNARYLVQCDRLFGPASGQRLQCFRSGNGGTDGRAQCVPLSWRTEIERLTFDVLCIGSRQLVQGYLHLSGRSFLRMRTAAQECEPGSRTRS